LVVCVGCGVVVGVCVVWGGGVWCVGGWGWWCGRLWVVFVVFVFVHACKCLHVVRSIHFWAHRRQQL